MKDKIYIHIYNNYYLGKYDKLNISLYERKLNSKTGKERYEPIYYYSSLSHMLKGIKKLYTRDSVIKHIKNEDLEELITKLEEVQYKIENHWEEL